jgi:rhodanese-related sulfurtransferase
MRPRQLFALLIFALTFTACSPAPENTVGTLSGADLMARLDAGDAPLILDVRSPGEYAAGHIPGAVNIPHDALGVRLDELGADPDREIVVHCQSGRRAATAEQMLMDAGYTGIQHLDGDMAGWRSAGLPVEMDAAP